MDPALGITREHTETQMDIRVWDETLVIQDTYPSYVEIPVASAEFFHAVESDDGVELTWKTLAESGSRSFRIERRIP